MNSVKQIHCIPILLYSFHNPQSINISKNKQHTPSKFYPSYLFTSSTTFHLRIHFLFDTIYYGIEKSIMIPHADLETWYSKDHNFFTGIKVEQQHILSQSNPERQKNLSDTTYAGPQTSSMQERLVAEVPR